MLWNVALGNALPPAFAPGEFWRQIPSNLAAIENSLRFLIFAIPFFMPLRLRGPALGLFFGGTLLYFASWLPLIFAPDSWWSRSVLGFLAPAYTPLLWLIGLALTGRELFWGSFYRWWMYLIVAMLFTASHILHAWIVYARN